GDYSQALNHNPILQRYVPAIAAFLRQHETSHLHVRYEDLVKTSEDWMKRVYEYIGVPFESETINYGQTEQGPRKGLGDPIGVQQHSRPSTSSLQKWVEELSSDPHKRALMQRVIQELDPEDLKTCGYPVESLWDALEKAGERKPAATSKRLTRYRLQRILIVRLRNLARSNGLFRSCLTKMKLVCDVLLRE
ncbi:MAG: sulfotransferase, partial [Candidatus Hydrogenedentes bacterium]|nr:sulfotransferase [Candidatus Hydrogenedentota bacterium]